MHLLPYSSTHAHGVVHFFLIHWYYEDLHILMAKNRLCLGATGMDTQVSTLLETHAG